MHNVFNFARNGLMYGTLVVGGALSAQAETTPPSQSRQIIVENHKKAAEMHSKMAACLASEKTLEQCREEMAASCSASFGTNCPMGGGMRGQGMGRGRMGGGPCMGWMLDPGASSPESTPDAAPKK